jgi:hypothetical protein
MLVILTSLHCDDCVGCILNSLVAILLRCAAIQSSGTSGGSSCSVAASNSPLKQERIDQEYSGHNWMVWFL